MRWDRMRDALHFFADERAFRLRLFGEGALVGVGVGVVIFLFRWLLELTEVYRPIFCQAGCQQSDPVIAYHQGISRTGWQFSWLECRLVTAEIRGSSSIDRTIND